MKKKTIKAFAVVGTWADGKEQVFTFPDEESAEYKQKFWQRMHGANGFPSYEVHECEITYPSRQKHIGQS